VRSESIASAPKAAVESASDASAFARRRGMKFSNNANWPGVQSRSRELPACAGTVRPVRRLSKRRGAERGRGSRSDAMKLPAPFNAGTSSLCGSLKSPLRLCVRNTPYHRTLNRPGRDPREIGITWMKKRRTTDFTDDSQKGNSSIRVIREIRGSSSPSSAFICG
jgi:hypothetical protein